MSRPCISVVIPVYNCAEFLPECLASVERQTLSDIEVICIDDASSDESPAILERFAREDDRFKVVTLTENGGPSAARNKALAIAQGEYVAFMDSDDWYPEDTSLEKLYRAAADHDAYIAGGSIDELNTITGEAITDYSNRGHEACFTLAEEGPIDYRDWQFDYGFTRFIYRLDFLRDKGLEFPILRRHEDPLFLVRAMIAAGSFYAIPDVVYRIRIGYKEHKLAENALDEAFESIAQIIALSVEHDLPQLRFWQKDVICWYMRESREYIESYYLSDLLRECAFRVARHLPKARS